jgi:hypothetical protein
MIVLAQLLTLASSGMAQSLDPRESPALPMVSGPIGMGTALQVSRHGWTPTRSTQHQDRMESIRVRAEKLPRPVRRATESRLERATDRIEVVARGDEGAFTRRLALEFGIAPEEWLLERSALGARWSELLIAHTLAASAPTGVNAVDLFRLYDEGVGWSRVANGLGFDLEGMTRAVEAECRVAAGRKSADGRVASIPSRAPGADAFESASHSTGLEDTSDRTTVATPARSGGS